MLAAVKTAKTPVEVAAVTTAVARVPPTLVSHGKTLVTVLVMATAARHVASVAHKAHALRVTTKHANHVMKCSARTHVAHVLTWASSVTTLTSASRPAMCQRAFHHLACQRAALVAVAGVAIAAVAAVVTLVEAAPAQVAAVVGAIRAAGFDADPIAG